MSGKHGFQDDHVNGDLSSPSKVPKVEKEEPRSHEERISRVKDLFSKSGGIPPMMGGRGLGGGGGMPPVIRPKPKPLKKPTPMETSTSEPVSQQENKTPEATSPLSPDACQDPGPIILNPDSLTQLRGVVEFDLDAVVRQQELLDTTAQKHKAYLSQGKGLQSRRLPSNLAEKVPEDYSARRRAQTYASSDLKRSTRSIPSLSPTREETDSGDSMSAMTDEERKQKILERSGVHQQSNPLAALSNILRRGSSGRGSFKGSKSPKKSLPESPRTTPKPKKRTSLDTHESPFRLGSEPPPKSPKGFLKGLRRSSSKSKKKTNGINESSEDLASETSSIMSLPVHGSVKDDSMETGAIAVGTVSPAKSADLSMNGDMESTDQGPSSSSPVASAKAQDLSVSPIKGGSSPAFISPVHTNRDSTCFKESTIESLFGSNSNLFDTSELDALLGREKRNKTPEKVLDDKDKSSSNAPPAAKYERAKTPDRSLLDSKKAVGVGIAAAHLRANRPASASSAGSAGLKARLKMYEANYKASSTTTGKEGESKEGESKEKEKEEEPETPPVLSSTPKPSEEAPKKKSTLLFEDEGEDDLFAVSASSKKDDKQAVESMEVDKKKASLFDDELFQKDQKSKEKEAPTKPASKVAPKIAPKIAPKTARRGLSDSPKREATRVTTPTSVASDGGDSLSSPARIASPTKRESSLSPVRTATPSSKKEKSPSPTPMEEDRVKSPKPADQATTKARASKEPSPSPVSPTPAPSVEKEKGEVKMEVETAKSAKSSDIFGPPLDDVGKPKAEEKKVTKTRGLFDEDESVGLFSSPSSRKRDMASGDQKSGKLFDDDLFGEKKTTKKSGRLFDDDEDSPLFSTKKETKPAAVEEEKEAKTEEKKPARSRGRFDDTPIPVFSSKKRKEREQKDQGEVKGESLLGGGSNAKSAPPKSSGKEKTSKLFDNIDEGDNLEGIIFDSKKSEAKPSKEERKSSPSEEPMEVDTLVEKTQLEKESEERAKEKQPSEEEKSELFAELKDEKEDKSEAAPEVKVTSPPTSPPPSKEEKIKEEKGKEESTEEKPTKSESSSGSRPSSRGRTSPRTARSKFETSDTKPSSRRSAASDAGKSSSIGKTRTPSSRDAKKGVADEGGKPAWMVEIQKRRENKKDEKTSSTPASHKETSGGSSSSAAGKETKEMPEWQKRALERKKKAEAEKASARSARLEGKSPRHVRKSDAGTSSPTTGSRSPSHGRRSAEMKKSDSTEPGTRSPRTRYGRNAEDKAEVGSRVKSARAEGKDKEEKASSEEKPKLTKKPGVEVTVKKTSSKVEESTTEKEKEEEEETRKSVSSEPGEKEEEKPQESVTKESKPAETEQEQGDESTDSGKPEEKGEEEAFEKKDSSSIEQIDSPKHSIEVASLVDSEKEIESSTDLTKKSISEDDKDSEASKKSSRTTSPLPDKPPSRSSSRQSNASSTDAETRAFRSHTISGPRSPTPTGSGSSYSGLPKTSSDDSIPEWKKKLLEKKKSGPTTPTRTKAATKEPEMPAWKKELMAKKASKPDDKSSSSASSRLRTTRERSATTATTSSSRTNTSSPRSNRRRTREPETPDFMKEFQRKKKTT